MPKAAPATPVAASAASTGPPGRGVRRPCGQLMSSSTPDRLPTSGFRSFHLSGQLSWPFNGSAPPHPFPFPFPAPPPRFLYGLHTRLVARQLGRLRCTSSLSPCRELAHPQASHPMGDQRLYNKAGGRSFSSYYERLKHLVVVALRWVVHNLAG